MCPDSVLKHSSKWEHADILVFNTYLWWRQGPVKLLRSTEENGICEEVNGLGAMESWVDWVVTKVNPLEKRVFFLLQCPLHIFGNENGSQEVKEIATAKKVPSMMKATGGVIQICPQCEWWRMCYPDWAQKGVIKMVAFLGNFFPFVVRKALSSKTSLYFGLTFVLFNHAKYSVRVLGLLSLQTCEIFAFFGGFTC